MQPHPKSFYHTQGNKKQLRMNTTTYRIKDEGLKLSVFLLKDRLYFHSDLTDILQYLTKMLILLV